jgi:hypothetical protein
MSLRLEDCCLLPVHQGCLTIPANSYRIAFVRTHFKFQEFHRSMELSQNEEALFSAFTIEV